MTASVGRVLDCANPERLDECWAPALGYVNLSVADDYVSLFPGGQSGPKLLPQRVAEPKTVNNRMYLDLEVRGIHAEADRLVALGANRVGEAPCSEHGSTRLLMADPESNECCVCDAGQGRPG